MWLVRMRAGKTLHQCVVVDGARKWILDSEEKHPVHLSAEALRACGGDGVPHLYVGEVREPYDSKVPKSERVVEVDHC